MAESKPSLISALQTYSQVYLFNQLFYNVASGNEEQVRLCLCHERALYFDAPRFHLLSLIAQLSCVLYT